MRFFFVNQLLVAVCLLAEAQPQGIIIKDLESEWKVFSNNEYLDYSLSTGTPSIYFTVDTDLYKGASLRVESQKEYSIFLGGRLITSNETGTMFFDLDSLSTLYSNPLSFSIKRNSVKISTQLVLKNGVPGANESLVQRSKQYFLDFSILASLILLIFFVVLLRTNPKLTFDYLNFIKLFSIQEREENIMAMRITSSVNLLFYTFTSLLTAFLLMVIFHFAHDEIGMAHMFQVSTLQASFFQWFKLTVLILLILFGKLVLISMFSSMYKASEITALQFFNFVRLFFFTFGVVSLLVVVFFMANVQNPRWYYNLFYVAASLFSFWQFVIFLKLMARLPFRIFHLFFYLCASELIPFVILIKVVFY